MSPLESAKVTGIIKKNTILYKSIYADIDLHYTIDDDRVKEDIEMELSKKGINPLR